MNQKSHSPLSRRGFLARAGVMAAGTMLPRKGLTGTDKHPRLGNLHPGIAAIPFRSDVLSGSTVILPVVREMVDEALIEITGESTATEAMDHLLTEGTANKSVAIKVNCINSYTPTRWEMVRAIIERLMAAGISPVDVVIFDNQDLNGCGFNSTNFPNGTGQEFDGLQFLGRGSCPYPVPGTTCNLSERIVNADYLINAPVLKGHWGVTDQNFHFTLGMKNHYGSISGLTHTFPDAREMLGRISADPVHVRSKTIMIALSAIFGYYSSNGPGYYPENWDTFGGTHPKRLILSTDPITVDHIGIEMINHERVLNGITEKTDTYVEYAATTFGIGIYDFDAMTVYQWIGTPPMLSISQLGSESWRLTWNYMNGAYGYRLYRSTNAYSGWNELTDITDPSVTNYDITGSTPESGYFYRIEAYNTFGTSPLSSPAGTFPYEIP